MIEPTGSPESLAPSTQLRGLATMFGALCLTLSLSLGAAPAGAAIEHDRDTNGGGFGDQLGDFVVTVAPGDDRYLLVTVTIAGAGARVISVDYAGQSLGFIGATASPSQGCRLEWWGLSGPPVGTAAVRLAFSARVLSGTTAISYRGVEPRWPLRALVATAGMAGPSRVSTPSAPGEVVLDGVCGVASNSVLAMAGGGQTARWHWSTGSLSSAGSQQVGGAEATATWTESGPASLEWAATAFALRPTGAPAPDLEVSTSGCSYASGGAPSTQPAQLTAWWWVALALSAWAARRVRRKRA